VRNGRVKWVGAALARVWMYPFHAYDKWDQGLSGGQLIPHSLHAVQLLIDDLVITSDCPVISELMELV
jgi:hypothetical protein